MQFREKEYRGFILRLVDLPEVGPRGRKKVKCRHWKVMRDGKTVTTATGYYGAMAKARAAIGRETE